jgi:hypothetical protein
MHFSARQGRNEYQHRYCGYRQQDVLGDEAHIFLACPATAHLRDELIPKIDRELRLLDARPWSSYTDTQRVGVLLGNPPPSLLKKHLKSWTKVCVPLIHPHTTELRSTLGALRDPSPSGTGDDASDSEYNDAVRQAIIQHSLYPKP